MIGFVEEQYFNNNIEREIKHNNYSEVLSTRKPWEKRITFKE